MKRLRVDAGASWSGVSRASRGPGRVRRGRALLPPEGQPAARAKRRAVARRAVGEPVAASSPQAPDVAPPQTSTVADGPVAAPVAPVPPDLATLARSLYGPLNGVELDLYGRRGELPAREGRAW